ncbi:MAG TPA: carboxy terminal-processing peptidase [Chthoniobacteraceae bacterium]|nr:carboxy terminal-processing peptidase [Chthoniobacteraceae bacterium]
MKLTRFPCFALAFLSLYSFAGARADEPDPGQIEISVARLLEQGHYSRRKLDERVGQQLLKNYLEALDYNRVYFTQKDVDAFTSKYGSTLDNDILLGNPDPAFKIFKLYRQRVEDRIAKTKELLKQKFDFTSDKMIEVNRQKAPWPKDEAEADQIWRDRLEGELLQETLNKSEKEPIARISKRYDQMLRNLHELNNEDIVKGFLTTLAQAYDPHSEYMSRSELENFSINMRLSLVGIGAVLKSEEGYAKIMELVPGGPAAKDGRIKVGDRVTSVAQGDKEFVDVVDMKLDKVVEMIRGKKDTIVRLQVIPVSASDPGARKVIEIKRDEIKLKEQEAKAEIIERPGLDGQVQRLGWIVLPSFYADMEHTGAANAKSTTKDVLALINRLKSEGITGLVMDLRRNGGGSLEEAVNLTGLFIKRGPVVQAKDSNGAIHVSKDRDPSVAWDGPLLVLCNRLSASASEIFAAALQDYNRAVIVGDQNTFGKGTVQTMLEIGRIMPFLGSGGNEAGALKLTIQKFYRIAGGSTQLRGVESDVKLPSPYDHPEIGESSLKGPMPYDTVEAVPFDKVDKPLFKAELRSRSAARVAADAEFRYIADDLNRVKQRLAENKISLNEKVRRAELDEDKARKDARTADRAKIKPVPQKTFSLTLENVNKPELQLASNEKKDGKDAKSGKAQTPATKTVDDDDLDDEEEATAKGTGIDPIKVETLNVLNDLVDLQRTGGKGATASATTPKQNQQ